MTRVLHEVQAADMLGFTRIANFRRAVSEEKVPKPTRYLGKRDPVWAEDDLKAWIDAKKPGAQTEPTEDDVIERLPRFG